MLRIALVTSALLTVTNHYEVRKQIQNTILGQTTHSLHYKAWLWCLGTHFLFK